MLNKAITFFRHDGRKPTQVRAPWIVSSTDAMLNYPTLFYAQGNTRLMASMSGPFANTSSSNETKMKLQVNIFEKSGCGNREMSIFLSTHLSKFIIHKNLLKSEVRLSVRVLQKDGPWASQAFNACFLLLVSKGIPFYCFPTAVELGVFSDTLIRDPGFKEEKGLFFIHAEKSIKYASITKLESSLVDKVEKESYRIVEMVEREHKKFLMKLHNFDFGEE